MLCDRYRWYVLSPPEPAAHGKKKSSYEFLLLLLSRRSDGPAEAHAPVDVLLFLFCWFQDLFTIVSDLSQLIKTSDCNIPGTNKANSHRRSSSHQHCQILHSSWERWTALRVVASRRTHNHPRRLGGRGISNPYRVSAGIVRRRRDRRWTTHRGRFRSNQWYPCRDRTRGDRREDRSQESISVIG